VWRIADFRHTQLYWDANEVKEDWIKAGALLVGADVREAVRRVKLRVRSLMPEIARVAAALLELGELDKREILRGCQDAPAIMDNVTFEV
jgi:hypothetical protein